MGEHRKPKPGPQTDHYVQGWKAGLMYARYLMVNSESYAEARSKVERELGKNGDKEDL